MSSVQPRGHRMAVALTHQRAIMALRIVSVIALFGLSVSVPGIADVAFFSLWPWLFRVSALVMLIAIVRPSLHADTMVAAVCASTFMSRLVGILEVYFTTPDSQSGTVFGAWMWVLLTSFALSWPWLAHPRRVVRWLPETDPAHVPDPSTTPPGGVSLYPDPQVNGSSGENLDSLTGRHADVPSVVANPQPEPPRRDHGY